MENLIPYIPLLAIPLAVNLIPYIWALVNAARNAKWVWFVLMLFVAPLCILYLIFAYESRPKRGAVRERYEPR